MDSITFEQALALGLVDDGSLAATYRPIEVDDAAELALTRSQARRGRIRSVDISLAVPGPIEAQVLAEIG